MKIWPAKPPKLAPAGTSPLQAVQVTTTTKIRKVMQDKITRGVTPAVPVTAVPLAEGRIQENEYVDKNWDKLERGTDYSAGPDSSSREVTPGKIETLANGLAVIADGRRSGVEVERNWAPAEPTPSPTINPAKRVQEPRIGCQQNQNQPGPITKTQTQTKTKTKTPPPPPPKLPPTEPSRTVQVPTPTPASGTVPKGTIAAVQGPDGDLYEDASKARPARAITPDPSESSSRSAGDKTLIDGPGGPRGACHGCGKGESETEKGRGRNRGSRRNEFSTRYRKGHPGGVWGNRKEKVQHPVTKNTEGRWAADRLTFTALAKKNTSKARQRWTTGHQGENSNRGHKARNHDQED